MKVNYAHVCDFATLGQNGKPVLVGLFTRIFVPSVPFTFDRFHVFLSVEMGHADSGQDCVLKIDLVDPDEIRIVGQEFNRKADDVQPTSEHFFNVVWSQVPFAKYGPHELRVTTSRSPDIQKVPLIIAPRPE